MPPTTVWTKKSQPKIKKISESFGAMLPSDQTFALVTKYFNFCFHLIFCCRKKHNCCDLHLFKSELLVRLTSRKSFFCELRFLSNYLKQANATIYKRAKKICALFSYAVKMHVRLTFVSKKAECPPAFENSSTT